MSKIQVYDKPMCCSTGVCGPQVDPVLPRFAADLEWLKSAGHQVERYNLAQQPSAFVENKTVTELLAARSIDCLPLVVVNGDVVSHAEYPSREQLTQWASGGAVPLPVTGRPGGCCGGSSCC